VRQLHVLGVSDDGDTLLLGTTAQGKVTHRLPLDSRLRQAIRGQLTAPGSDRAESVLSPKEIQARLRAGATPDEVAKVARVPVARVMPYFAPVEAERERIVEEARRAVLHRNRAPVPTQPLGDVVDARLREVAGLKDDSVAWTARRRADGAWVVRLTYTARGGQRRAEWLWQPASRELSALDPSATRLAAEAAAPKRKPVRRPAAKKAPAKKAPATRRASAGRTTKAAAKRTAAAGGTAKTGRVAKPAAATKTRTAPARKPAVTKAQPTRVVAAKPAATRAAPKRAAATKAGATKAGATKAAAAKRAPARRTVAAAASTTVPRPAKPAVRRSKTKPAPVPTARPVLEVVPDPVPVEVLAPAAPAAVAAPPAPARRPGTRVPVPSWSDVLLGVTGPVTATRGSESSDTDEADADGDATPRTSSGGRRRRT
jgi:hypothetical protein